MEAIARPVANDVERVELERRPAGPKADCRVRFESRRSRR
jgi:hypothetical protein